MSNVPDGSDAAHRCGSCPASDENRGSRVRRGRRNLLSSLTPTFGRLGARPRDMADHDDWWGTVDAETVRCLSEHGPMTPDELGKRLGMSEEAAASLIS